MYITVHVCAEIFLHSFSAQISSWFYTLATFFFSSVPSSICQKTYEFQTYFVIGLHCTRILCQIFPRIKYTHFSSSMKLSQTSHYQIMIDRFFALKCHTPLPLSIFKAYAFKLTSYKNDRASPYDVKACPLLLKVSGTLLPWPELLLTQAHDNEIWVLFCGETFVGS